MNASTKNPERGKTKAKKGKGKEHSRQISQRQIRENTGQSTTSQTNKYFRDPDEHI